MTTFSMLFFIGVGLVIKTLVYMPWFDEPVKSAYQWVKLKLFG